MTTDIRHPTSLAVANRYLGYVHSLRGQMETAVQFLERALAIAREHDNFLATIWTSHLAYALVLLGQRERAWSISCRRSRDRAGSSGRGGISTERSQQAPTSRPAA